MYFQINVYREENHYQARKCEGFDNKDKVGRFGWSAVFSSMLGGVMCIEGDFHPLNVQVEVTSGFRDSGFSLYWSLDAMISSGACTSQSLKNITELQSVR